LGAVDPNQILLDDDEVSEEENGKGGYGGDANEIDIDDVLDDA
jgi:hypothetical protein